MRHLLIFGTGKSAEKVLLNIDRSRAVVDGYLDNNPAKQGTQFHGAVIYNPADCAKKEFDYILIASVKYDPITEQLCGLGIKREKILSYFAFDHEDYDRFREILHVEGMIHDEMELKLEHMQKYVKNMEYEIADRIRKGSIQIPRILTIDETIKDLAEKRLSISRYGDGEFDQIAGRREGYQEPSDTLAERLKEVLMNPIEGHVVGLPDIYGDLSHLAGKYADYFRDVLLKYRSDHYQYLDMKRTYHNAFISRLYSEMEDKQTAKLWFDGVKKIWENRDVIIVEGDKTRFGVGNDLLEHARSVKRILGPSEGAFESYDKILSACRKYGIEKEDGLFVLALGPTATVLAYDLAKEGYQALDLGHFDIEYEWYLRGVREHKIAIQGKYTNEVVGGNVVADLDDEKYCREIVELIS